MWWSLILLSIPTSSAAVEIVVTGSRGARDLEATAVLTEVVDRETLLRSGAESVADVLTQQAGVTLNRSFNGASLQLQGLDATYLLVLVDGQRVGGRINGAVDLSRFPTERVERIEIVKGASSALYGADALAGVVNIITRRAEVPLEGSAHLSVGSRSNLDLSGQVGGQLGPADGTLSVGWHRTPAYDLDPSGPATNGSASSEWSAAGRGQARFGDLRLDFSADASRRESQGVDENAAGAVFDRSNRTEIFSLTGGPSFSLGDARITVTGHGNFFRDQYLLDQRGSAALDDRQDTQEALGQLTLQADQILGWHTVSVGLEGLYESLATQRLLSGAADRGRLSVYAQDEWGFLDFVVPFSLVLGARADADTQFGVHPTPKIGIRIDPHERLTLRASVAFGYRAPSFRELYLIFENPSVGYVVKGSNQLRPEHSLSSNASASLRLLPELSTTVSVFRNDIDDLISVLAGEHAPGAPIQYRYTNVSAARTQGLEATLKARPLGAVGVELGYYLLDTYDFAQQRPLDGRARHRFTATVDLRFAAIGWSLMSRTAVNSSRRYYVESEGGVTTTQTAAPYASWDLRMEQSLGDHAALFAGVDNLLDAGDPALLPLSPRTIYGGLNARY